MSGGSGHGCPGAPDTVVRATTTKPVVCIKPLPQLQQENVSDGAKTTAEAVGGGGDLCFPKDLSTAQRRAIDRQLKGLEACDAQQVLDELADVPVLVLLFVRWMRLERTEGKRYDDLSDEELAELTRQHLRQRS